MALIRSRPRAEIFPEMSTFQDRFRRIFDELDGETQIVGWAPPVEISETTDDLVITAEMPGLSEEDVEIELENDLLTIRGEKTAEEERKDEERKMHVWERRYGSFRRSFRLPRTIDPDRVEARFDRGVLTVRLPKVEQAKGRKIRINE